MGASVPGRLVRFGRFDLDLRVRELRRDGVKVRLQDQPFRILALLLEKPGEVVTREELRERLWAGDTFVDFERGLNNAVRRLREALGDSAEIPRFVDTIPRVGYRFVGPVEGAGGLPALPPPATEPPRAAAPRGRWTLLALGGVLMAAAVLSVILTRPRVAERPTLRYLTHSGQDWGPAASPDGRRVAFTSERDGRRRIWLTDLAKGDESPLTTGPADSGARFSPDGGSILFTRIDAGIATLYLVPSSGGEPRRLLGRATSGDWSPDGRRLAYTWYARGERPAYVLGVAGTEGDEPTELALVEASWMSAPRWSPDGRSIAAAHVLGSTGEWAMLVVDAASGEQRRLRPPQRLGALSVPAWSSDGRDLLFLQADSGPDGQNGWLVRQRWPGGDATTLLPLFAPGPGLDTAGPRRLVADASVARQNLREHAAGGGPSDRPRWLTRGFSHDRQPVYSPDGARLVFTSNRSGNLDLWALSIGSGILRRLTEHPAEDRDPRVMPSGRIVWASNRTGAFEVWVAEADGSSPRPVTRGGTHAQDPVPTPDESWIYYTTPDPERRGVWKIRPDGSDPTPLVPGSVGLGDVSPDGRFMLLVESHLRQTVLRVARVDDLELVPFEIVLREAGAGGEGPPKSEHASPCPRWMAGGRAVAFVDVDEHGRRGVSVQAFTPGRDRAASRRPLGDAALDAQTQCFGISPDGQRITLALEEVSRHLVMIDGVPGAGR